MDSTQIFPSIPSGSFVVVKMWESERERERERERQTNKRWKKIYLALISFVTAQSRDSSSSSSSPSSFCSLDNISLFISPSFASSSLFLLYCHLWLGFLLLSRLNKFRAVWFLNCRSGQIRKPLAAGNVYKKIHT